MEPTSTHERTVWLGCPPKNEHPVIGMSAEQRGCQARSGRGSPCGSPATTVPEVSLRERRACVAAENRATQARRSQATTRSRRCLRETAILGGRVLFLTVVAISLLASTACGGTGQARGDASVSDPEGTQKRDVQERTPAAEARADGDGAAQAGNAGAGTARAGTADAQARTGDTVTAVNSKGGGAGNVERKSGSQEVTLRVTGEPGTGFSGTCSVGGKERTLDGRTPELYAFGPQGKKLECEVRKKGGGALGIIFTNGEGVRSEQRVDAGEGTVTFAYSNGSVSSSMSSVSVNRAVTSSVGSSSQGSR